MEDKAVFSYDIKYIDDTKYNMHSVAGFFYAADFEEALKYLKGVEHPRIISCHIGSGASITAIKDGTLKKLL